jgi:hypothetical protein
MLQGFVPEDTVACAADGKTVEELVAERLALGDSGKTTRLDLGGVKGDAVRWEAEAVGDQAGKLVESKYSSQDTTTCS